jgi:ribulose 1,5-bisphosphate synthetase/thiazole synthase
VIGHIRSFPVIRPRQFSSAYTVLDTCSILAYIVQMAQVIVVGGGLAGLSAAHTILERGGNVLLLDKQP